MCIYDVQVLNYKHYLTLFLTYPMNSIHLTIYMYLDIYKDSLYSIKAQHFSDTCHHNLYINVALSCSLLVIEVTDMSYKNTYFYTCVRVYKYRRKTYINFLNIIQSEPLPDLLTYFTFYVKYIYLWFSARGIHSGLFFGLMETVGFLFLSCFFFRDRLQPLTVVSI